MAGDKPTPKTKPKEEGTPKKKSEAAAKKDTPKKKEKSPAKESKQKEQEPAAEPAAEPAKEEESIAVYMAAGIGEMLHGKKEDDSDDDESNFLERGVNFLGELVDDIKALPDEFSGPEGGRADKTKVVVRIVSHLDHGNRTLAPVVLIDLVAAILEVPAKLIQATHEKVVALSQIPIPKLIEELWRTVKKTIIETYFRFLGLEDEDVDVRVACDIIKNYPNSNDIETELNQAGFAREGRQKAINTTMSKKWMCEKIASSLDADRDGKVSADEAKVLIAQHRGISESEALDHEDIKVLKGDIGRVSNCLFKYRDRDVIDKYYEILDCANPEPPAEVLGKFAAIISKWNKSFLMKVKLQDMGWKKMGAMAKKAAEVSEAKRKAEQQKRLRAQEQIKKK